MSKLQWDLTGEKFFELGVSKGVLYPMAGANYGNGVAWNGLIGVNESPEGGEPNDMWADNIKYASARGASQFKATIEAYTYPDEFAACIGELQFVPGVYAGQQKLKPFGFCYRTEIGNDVDPEIGYKIHLVYGATAVPSENSNATNTETPEGRTMSWELDTVPVDSGVVGMRPVAHLYIDTRTIDADKLAELEEILYGTVAAEPRLILPAEFFSIVQGDVVVPTVPTFVAATGILTIPTVVGVEYKVNGVTAAAGAQTAAPGGTLLQVTAHALSGYYFELETPRAWAFVSTLV